MDVIKVTFNVRIRDKIFEAKKKKIDFLKILEYDWDDISMISTLKNKIKLSYIQTYPQCITPNKPTSPG